jgi:hypothetical protein
MLRITSDVDNPAIGHAGYRTACVIAIAGAGRLDVALADAKRSHPAGGRRASCAARVCALLVDRWSFVLAH